MQWIKFEDNQPDPNEVLECIICFREKYAFDTEWTYNVCEGWTHDYGGYLRDDRYNVGFDTYNDWCEGQQIEFVAWMPMPTYKES